MSVRLDVEPDLALEPCVSTAIYRMVREGIVNAAKDAGATSIEATVRRSCTGIEAIIADDGCGIGSAAHERSPSGAGFGLSFVHERVRSMGGAIQIESRDAGTSLTIRVPLAARVAEASA